MTVVLYANISPANKMNKTLGLYRQVDGVLKVPTSVIDPTITFELDEVEGYNYMWVPDLRRYYFITNKAADSNRLVSVGGHVDVLMTYKDIARAFKVIVRRNEYKFNLYLDDGMFKAYQNTKHKIIRFPYGFTEYSYVLALAGNYQDGT